MLHGWPEFWYTWRKNIPVLAEEFDVFAPDLRGFGDTDKPGLPDPPKRLPSDLVEDLQLSPTRYYRSNKVSKPR